MRVVLTGATGQLGGYVWKGLKEAGHEVWAWGHSSPVEGLVNVELSDSDATERALAGVDPDVIIHTAAVSTADGVRSDPARGRAVNVEATARLADWCGRRGRRLVFTSTDLVFPGSKAWNSEDDQLGPRLAYGSTKAEAEPFVRGVPGGLVVRLSLLYGPSRSPGRSTYMDRTIAAWKRGEPQTFFGDEFRTPLDLATAAEALVRLAGSDESSVIHLGGRERLSRYELVLRIASALGFDPDLVRANRQADVPSAEPRPADVSLDTRRFATWFPDLRRPDIEEAASAMWNGIDGEISETLACRNV
jgi:dTDP-4-dehydrorhamnose reductase